MTRRTLICFLLFCLLSKQELLAQYVQGFVMDRNTREILVGVNIFLPASGRGTQTDLSGYFHIDEQEDSILVISYLGYEAQSVSLRGVKQDSLLLVLLDESAIIIGEAVVKAEAKSNPAISVLEINTKQIKMMPSFGGEADIVQAFHSMPGVKKAGDANGGMLVRGGSSDQNNVVLDGVPIYQSGHIISFYSPFQSELIGSAKLYKGMIPASLGGRLSSALELKTAPASDSLQVDLGLSILLGKAYIQTPIVPGKWSMQLAGRRSLPDLVWPVIGEQFPAKFFDGRMIHNFQLSSKNQLRLSFYQSTDELLANGKTISKFKETEKSLMPDMQLLSKNTERNMALSFTHQGPWNLEAVVYASDLKTSNAMSWADNALEIHSGIRDFGMKTTVAKSWKGHQSYAGVSFISHHFSAMGVSSSGTIGEVIPSKKTEELRSGEGSLFLGDTWKLSPIWSIESGMRLAVWTRSSQARVLLEPKLAVNFIPTVNWSVQFAVQRNTQSLQKLGSNSISLPTDMWYPTNLDQPAPSAWQGDISIAWKPENWSMSVSGYYKIMDGLNEFNEGATPFLATRIQDEVVSGSGRAYGTDISVAYHAEAFTAQLGYSLSWSTRQFDDLNGGNRYFDRFDRRHDLSFQFLGQLGGNWSYSCAFYLATGARFTPRLAQYVIPGIGEASPVFIPVYGERNSQKLSSSHRIDIALNYQIKTPKATWQFQAGAYNVYNQMQAFRIENVERNGRMILREVGLFGMMPSLGLSVKF